MAEQSGGTKVAVIGAGLCGLTAALRLQQAGHHVTLYERGTQVGGLAAAFEIGGQPLEMYYHHVFTHDVALRRLVDELGLGDRLKWHRSSMATYHEGRLYPFQTPLDLLRFSPLPFFERLRFGLATLYARSLKDWQALEGETAEAWLTRCFGQAGYRTVWQPLLQKKFGPHAHAISAAWMWGKIALRGTSRERGAERELLGYMDGSFRALAERAAEAFVRLGGDLRLGSAIERITRVETHWTLDEDGPFDAVLLAVPPRIAMRLVGDALPAAERAAFDGLGSRAAVVSVLQLDRPLTGYYWINVNDAALPFGGVIEHTNLVAPEAYGGAHIVYLSRYLGQDEPLWQFSQAEVLTESLPSLSRLNPHFDPSWIQASWVFRDSDTQPVVTPGHAQRRPPTASTLPGLYFANMHHIYPQDRGMNYAISLGESVAASIDGTRFASVQRHADHAPIAQR